MQQKPMETAANKLQSSHSLRANHQPKSVQNMLFNANTKRFSLHLDQNWTKRLQKIVRITETAENWENASKMSKTNYISDLWAIVSSIQYPSQKKQKRRQWARPFGSIWLFGIKLRFAFSWGSKYTQNFSGLFIP